MPKMQTRLLAHVCTAPLVTVALSLATFGASAQSGLQPFTLKSTVNDFALECQHPAKKSQETERMALCASYVNSAVLQIALSKRSPQCWAELEAGKAAPGPIMDALFHIASQPDQRNKQLASELRFVVVEVAAKSCK